MSYVIFTFSHTGTFWLKSSSLAQRDHFLGDLSAAITTANRAVVKGTSEKQLCAWKCFQGYLQSIGIQDDPFLDGFDRG
jgi:hypothetical protein